MTERYFTLDEAAEHMRVSKDTIERAIRAQKLRAKKTGKNGGGRYLVAASALDAWFDTLVDA